MNVHTRRKLTDWISILVIICMLGNMLPPAVHAAPQPPWPDYTENLLAVSSTLEQDDKGNLSFPHPEARPGSAKGVILPYAELANPMLDLDFLPDLPNNVPLISGQSSRVDKIPEEQASLLLTMSQSTPPIFAPPLQLTISGYSGPLPLQSQTAITQVFLPVVIRDSPPASVVGKKAIFNILLPDANLLTTALGFSAEQIEQIQIVIDAEQAAIVALDTEAAAITNDERRTLAEKQAAIAAMDYNGRLRTILAGSQTELENLLGETTYTQLINWLDHQWQLFVAQRNAIRSTAGEPNLSATDTVSETCQVFDLFATRSSHPDLSADLPDKYVKFANQGTEYSEGYTNTIIYSITVKYNTTVVSNVVVTDVVWNHNDNYWNTVTDTVHPRRLFTDLPHGMPEAEAAFIDGYNSGFNEFGQEVTNPAGLNISDQVANLLGISGNAWVEVTFPWGCIPDNQLTSSRLERAWGTDNTWSRYAAHLLNPVTGNQLLWFRDLYIPAPGLPVDLVRYYNSQDGADGIFGRGWSSQFDMRVYPQADGSYKVRYEDGQRGVFRPDGVGGFVGDAGVFDTFAVETSGFVLTTTDRMTYHFDNNGRLQNIRDLVGNQITLTYNGADPIQIIDSVGRAITLTFNSDGHVTHIQDPAGRVVTYTYGVVTTAPLIVGVEPTGVQKISATSVSAPLQGVTDPNGGMTSYEYDPATQALTKATDPDTIAFVENLYDAQGRVREQRNAAGKGTFQYDLENLRATFTDNLSNTTTYIFDKKYRVIEEIDALGHSIHYKYDDQDNLIEKTDKRGNTWKYEYDSQGNMTRREDPIDTYSAVYYNTDVTTWEYNERNQVTKMTNALGEITQYGYDTQGNLIKVTEPNSATTTSTFNSQGQMTNMTDAEGRSTSFEYDAHGNRNKIIDPNEGITFITYDAVGRVLSRTDPESNTTRYEYDGNGNVTKIIDTLGSEIRREYDGNNMLVQQIDRRGGVYEFKYDADLNMTEQKDPLGNVTHYEYDAMHNRTKMIAPNGAMTAYEYDPLYRITRMTDPAGYVTHYEYDENGNMTKAIDALKGETRFEYDAVNRRKFVYDALGHQTEFCYDALDRAICNFDPRRALTRYEYDQVGNMKRVIDPLGAVTSMTYDQVHNRTSVTDPNGHTTHYEYDQLSRLIAETDPLGNVMRTAYDKVGNTTAITDANGHATTFQYNANYWLIRSVNALSQATSFTYDTEGNQLSAINAKGHPTFISYDLLGRVVATTDELGQTTHFRYDANGNQIAVTDAKENVTRYEYDARDLLIKEIDSLGHVTRYEYDGLKRLVRIIDPNVKATIYAYDPISRLTGVADAKGQVYRYDYDEVGNQTVVTDSQEIATHFEYNLRNERVKESNPLTRSWAYHYDPAGNMIMQVDGKLQAIRYEYDAANRLVKTNYPDGKRVIYAYDPNSNQTHMVDWNGVFTETYDALNRRTSTTDYKGRQLTYTYDQVGNLTSLGYPDGKQVTYDYNARYELETMADPAGLVTRYQYDPVGLLTSQIRPNDTRTDLSYDQANRLTKLSNTRTGGGVIASFDFTLDNVGNRLQMVETRSGAPSVAYAYEYDDIYQLINVTSDQGQDMDYAYDPAGNRDSMTGTPKPPPDITASPAISVTYEYDELNTMVRAGKATFKYDKNGNRIRTVKPISETKYANISLRGVLITDYFFDVENRLVTARETISYETVIASALVYTQAVVMEADYSYDGMGRRVAKLVQKYNLSGIVTEALVREYVYNGLDVVAEYEYINGALQPDINHYYYANSEKVTLEKIPRSRPAKKYWYAYDALGTTAALLNENGLAVAEYHYDEYGRLIVGDSLFNHYLFTGQEYDSETGLIHFFARYYDSETGVWLTQDIERGEITNPATLHRYMYVSNNPVNLIDALGYSWWNDAWNSVTNAASRIWNETKEIASKAVDWVDEQVVKPVVETVKDAGEWISKNVVQPVVKRVSETAEWVNKNVIQPIKEKVEEVINYVNENYTQTAINKVKEAIQSTREALTKSADWIQEQKTKVSDEFQVASTNTALMISDIGKLVYQCYDNYKYASGAPYYPYYDQCSNTGEPVTQVWAVGPFDAWTAKNLANESFKVASETMLPGAHNGQQDAFRHCYWSCRMAQEIGADDAKRVGDIHEACGGNPSDERDMDLYNNALGRNFANGNCRQGCLQTAQNGTLRIL